MAWPRRPRLLPTPKEAREVTIYLLLLPFAFLPDALGDAASRLLARFVTRRSSAYPGILARLMPPEMRPLLGRTPRDGVRAVERLHALERIQLLREIFVPWRRHPVGLEGIEHLEQALAAGRGAILWVQPCLTSNVTVKRALNESGHPLVHLSRPGHPFSSNPFGARFVNPLFRRPELRYLHERVVISDGYQVGPLRRLRECLGENLPVSITVSLTAAKVDTVPFMSALLRLPRGPIELAGSSGAALLPVFTRYEEEASVIIGPPLPVAGRDAKAAFECEWAFADWLCERVLESPRSWTGWRAGLVRTFEE